MSKLLSDYELQQLLPLVGDLREIGIDWMGHLYRFNGHLRSSAPDYQNALVPLMQFDRLGEDHTPQQTYLVPREYVVREEYRLPTGYVQGYGFGTSSSFLFVVYHLSVRRTGSGDPELIFTGTLDDKPAIIPVPQTMSIAGDTKY